MLRSGTKALQTGTICNFAIPARPRATWLYTDTQDPNGVNNFNSRGGVAEACRPPHSTSSSSLPCQPSSSSSALLGTPRNIEAISGIEGCSSHYMAGQGVAFVAPGDPSRRVRWFPSRAGEGLPKRPCQRREEVHYAHRSAPDRSPSSSFRQLTFLRGQLRPRDLHIMLAHTSPFLSGECTYY